MQQVLLVSAPFVATALSILTFTATMPWLVHPPRSVRLRDRR